ncbi:hypothetical protein SAY87_031765 [Trapa incisa]|uniref:X8 domain-containing protein n=1 Tax=Trapa incisa TaxID=236973 RepID=A0AAN7KVM1_9MYRT|nr:hypothetical protein SAY87_031765 [Trapa incisa]
MWRFIISLVLLHFTISDARVSIDTSKEMNSVLHSQNTDPYGIRNPDFSLPPFQSMSPLPLPAHSVPAFCVYPPPSSSAPAPAIRRPPAAIPRPPKSPQVPSVPECGPKPPNHTRRPPAYPPPPTPPPQQHKPPVYAVWCVAKPTVPDTLMQEAIDYACGAGADCKPIQPNGPCYQPNTLLAHASFAFNSYFQNKKILGGTCDFGGTAMLITVDPSEFISHLWTIVDT